MFALGCTAAATPAAAVANTIGADDAGATYKTAAGAVQTAWDNFAEDVGTPVVNPWNTFIATNIARVTSGTDVHTKLLAAQHTTSVDNAGVVFSGIATADLVSVLKDTVATFSGTTGAVTGGILSVIRGKLNEDDFAGAGAHATVAGVPYDTRANAVAHMDAMLVHLKNFNNAFNNTLNWATQVADGTIKKDGGTTVYVDITTFDLGTDAFGTVILTAERKALIDALISEALDAGDLITAKEALGTAANKFTIAGVYVE